MSWPHETSLTGLTGIACSSAGVDVSDVIANMFKKKGLVTREGEREREREEQIEIHKKTVKLD